MKARLPGTGYRTISRKDYLGGGDVSKIFASNPHPMFPNYMFGGAGCGYFKVESSETTRGTPSNRMMI